MIIIMYTKPKPPILKWAKVLNCFSLRFVDGFEYMTR